MKTKLTLIIALTTGFVMSGTMSSFAYDRDEHRDRDDNNNNWGEHRDHDGDHDRDWEHRRGEMQRHIDRVNRMLAHVKWQMNRYGADHSIRHDVDRISEEVRRVNWRFEHWHRGDRGDLRDDIQNLRGRLHHIEERMHVRSREYFHWD